MSGKHNKKFARSASGFHQPSMLLGLEDSICNTFPQICVKETKLNRHLHFSPVFPGHIGARMERLFVLEISSLDWMSLSSFPKYFLCPITLSHCRLKLLQASLLPMSCQILGDNLHRLVLCCSTVSYDCDILQIKFSNPAQCIEENTTFGKRTYRVLLQFLSVLGFSKYHTPYMSPNRILVSHQNEGQ